MDENKISLSWLLRIIFAILLIFAFTAGYYWSHKPVSFSSAMVLAQTIFGTLVWLFVLWVAAAIGTLILPQRFFKDNSISHLVLATGLGLGFLSLLIFGLGILGLLSSWIAWLSLFATAMLLRKQLKLVFSELHTIALPKPKTRLQKFIWAFGGLMFFTAFVNALEPPTAWDSLLYHLATPKLYINANQIGHPIDIFTLGYPPLGSMQYLFALLLVGERATALFHFAYGVLCLILIIEVARRYFEDNVAWHAALILVSIPTFFVLIGIPYNDGILMFYATASIYIFLRWHEEHNKAWLLSLGLLTGFSISVKYTAFPIPVIIALMMFWSSRRLGFQSVFRSLSIIALTALAVASPYYLENLITTGNPVYPLIFDNGIYWDSWRAEFLQSSGTGLAATAPLRLLIVPFEATVLGIEGTSGYGAAIGPLLFLGIFLLPFGWHLISNEDRKPLKYILVFISALYGFWLFGLARSALLLQTRFLMPAFGAMAVVGGLALSRIKNLKRPNLDFHWLTDMVLYINMILLAITAAMTFIQHNPIPVVIGMESKQVYLERRLGLYIIVMQEINQLPEESRVLFLWEPRGYHCEIDCRPDTLFDNIIHQTQHYKRSATDIAANWREQGITHVLLYQNGLEAILAGNGNPVEPEDLAILEDLKTNEMQLVEDFNGAYLLFELLEE